MRTASTANERRHTSGYLHDELATELSVELVELVDARTGLVVEVRGELGADTAPLLAAVFATVHAQEPPAVAVDLTEVSFLDSMGLSTLLEARARLMLRGASFGVRGVSGPARRLLRAAGVSEGLEPLAAGPGPDGTPR